MLPKITLPILLLLLFTTVNAQEYFPGGVAGAEAWYIVNHNDFDQQLFRNSSLEYVRITSCNTDMGGKGLFNFNHSLTTSQLCLKYTSPLEASTSRNVFFVGEPKETAPIYSHLTTGWNLTAASLPVPGAIIKNRFDLANKNMYVDTQLITYQSDNNANINFYNWNIYNTDKKYKSYGYSGETSFYIGKNFTNSLTDPATVGQYYSGNFPEFISFPFELTANQRNRVESYLALKYGITLNSSVPYRNAKNIAFWNQSNNTKFGSHIFGIGRDNISGLNQLQSESIHYKDRLIASVEKLEETNPIKQGLVTIDNNHFIVFGHNNGAEVLDIPNDFGARPLKRKWLSQNTGLHASELPMCFKVNLSGVLAQALALDPGQRLWMLHDKYVTNQQVSDFNSNYVEYYDPADDSTPGYGLFYKVNFDTDEAIYDQFTFAVGPQMIVQIRFDPGDCNETRKRAKLVITGGTAPYNIIIESLNSSYVLTTTTNETVVPFETVAPDTYTAYVLDAAGNEGVAEMEVVGTQIVVDLGPDQVLNATQQQIILNAGLNVTDAAATYQWYFNNVLLEHYAPVLVAEEAGEYTVVVTSGNHSCQESDTIVLSYNFTGTAWPGYNCENPAGTVTLNLSGGTPPYTTVISTTVPPISQVHDTNSFVFSNVPFGPHIVTTTDSNGSVFTSTADIPIPFEGLAVDLFSQIEPICGDINYNYFSYTFPVVGCSQNLTLDASLLVTYNNVGYEWTIDGQSTGIYDAVIDFVTVFETSSIIHEVTVEIMNLDTGCSITQTFGLKPGLSPQVGLPGANNRQGILNNGALQETDPAGITTKVYPNPSVSNNTFYYEVTATAAFDGTVEIYTPTGALLSQTPIQGGSSYKLPFSLITSGIYLICTKTNGITVTDKVIIK